VIVEQYISPSTGSVQEGFVPIRPVTVELESGGLLQYEFQPHWQRPAATFWPLPGIEIAPGAYNYSRHLLTVQTDPSGRLAGRLEAATGGYFDGALRNIRGVLQATPDPRLAISADYTLNRLRHVGVERTSVSTHLLGLETRVAANPRLQLVTFVQWNTAARQVSGNARLTWEHRPLAFFTIVYNHRAPSSGLADAVAPLASRQLLAKLTWLLQL
jgi:hypothetical protein